MLEIKNKSRSPIQLIVKGKDSPNSLKTINLPGIGSGKNVYYLEDERETPYISRLKDDYGLISVKKIHRNEVPNINKVKGE